jgi:hypothetical protein
MRKSEFQSLKNTLESNKNQAETFLKLCKKLEKYQKITLKTFSELISISSSSCEKSSTTLIELFTQKIQSSSKLYKNLSKYSSLFIFDLESLDTCFERVKYEERLWESYTRQSSQKQGALKEASEMVSFEENRLSQHIKDFVSSTSTLFDRPFKSSSTQESFFSSQKTQKPLFFKSLASSTQSSFNTQRKSLQKSSSCSSRSNSVHM